MTQELLLVLLGLPVGVTASVTLGVAVTVAMAHGWGRRDPQDELQAALFAPRRAGLVRRLWWIGIEGVLTTFSFSYQPLHALLRRRRLELAPGEGGTPVLLTAGYLENSAQMWLLARRLRARGFRVATLDLPNSLAPIATNVEVTRRAVQELLETSGAERVALVGHSMGGVIGRTLVHDHPELPVACVVSIASPHRGTHMARIGPGRSARDMSHGSPHQQAYPHARKAKVPVHCVVGCQENIVSPNWSAVLEEGENHVLDAPAGHLAPLYMPSVADLVARWLEQDGVRRAGAAPAESGAAR